MTNLNIPIILGTARKGRQSDKVANYVLSKAKEYGFESQLIDVKDFQKDNFTVPAWEPQAKDEAWRKIAQSADAFIFVLPEYNHGYPGEFKLLLDKLYEEYNHKPVGLCGVSGGRLGGARVVEHIKPVLIELQMLPIYISLNFSNIQALFDEEGNITDNKFEDRVTKFFDELNFYAQKLKQT